MLDKQTHLYYNVYVSNRGAVAVPPPAVSRGGCKHFHKTITHFSQNYHNRIVCGSIRKKSKKNPYIWMAHKPRKLANGKRGNVRA